MFHGTSRMHLLAIAELCQRNTKSKERIMETITLEYLSRKIESLQELTLSVLELLKTEKKNEKRRKEEKEELMEREFGITKALTAVLKRDIDYQVTRSGRLIFYRRVYRQKTSCPLDSGTS